MRLHNGKFRYLLNALPHVNISRISLCHTQRARANGSEQTVQQIRSADQPEMDGSSAAHDSGWYRIDLGVEVIAKGGAGWQCHRSASFSLTAALLLGLGGGGEIQFKLKIPRLNTK